MLTLRQLEKNFPDFHLGPIDLNIDAHQVVAVLGKNGSGKTTLFQMITGNMDASAGTCHLNGNRITPETPDQKRLIGYLPQNIALPPWVSGIEVLSYAAQLYGLEDLRERVEERLNYWDCRDFAKLPIAECSHGMQKRIGLALATLHDPLFLVLDEPFSGLNLFHIRALFDSIKSRRRKETVTIISTHIAPYAAKLCDRVVITAGGKIRPLQGFDQQSELEKSAMIERIFFNETL